jgi:predicted type IV restriction endonuclease
MADPAALVQKVLSKPELFLGAAERNVEAKLIAPVLEMLGWDPVVDVMWGHSVRRHTETGTTVVEADALVADLAQNRMRFVVEAKRWRRVLDDVAVRQVHGYLHDLGAQRALLTSGETWFVIDMSSESAVATTALRAHGR